MLHERVDDLPSSGAPPADVNEADPDPEVGLLSLPEDIARLERLRASAYAGLPDLTRVPTDVFVWRAGEPSRRAVTKIAGLPYRRAGLPWPLAASGEPLTFVAQLCFADSRDLVPPLPGDVLLIFAAGVPTLPLDIPLPVRLGSGSRLRMGHAWRRLPDRCRWHPTDAVARAALLWAPTAPMGLPRRTA